MHPVERLRRTLARQPVDRLPVGPYLANWTATLAGVPLSTYCTDARAMAQVQLAAWEQVGQDIIFPDADNYYLAEGFGCVARIEPDNFPSLERPALEQPEQVFELDVPDPERDGRMPVYLEATHRIAEQAGAHAAIRAPGTGPFAVAAYLVGVQEFLAMVGLIEHEVDQTHTAAIDRMLDLAAEAVTRFGLAQLRAGANILQCGDSLASGSMISPRTFRRFVLPRHQRIFAAWKAAGALTALHICGNNTHMLDLFAETGADIVAIDSAVDLAVAKARIGDRVTLIGNLDPVRVVMQGNPERVQAAAQACLAAASRDGGYILGTGCEVPPGSPLENVQTIIRVAHAAPAGEN